MNFFHADLGYQPTGAMAIVRLATAANVRLLDDSNFRSYQSGRQYRGYHMGFYRRSPLRLGIPTSGHWHVVVDLGGCAGTIGAAVQVRQPVSA
jgi:hypothetical protein